MSIIIQYSTIKYSIAIIIQYIYYINILPPSTTAFQNWRHMTFVCILIYRLIFLAIYGLTWICFWPGANRNICNVTHSKSLRSRHDLWRKKMVLQMNAIAVSMGDKVNYFKRAVETVFGACYILLHLNDCVLLDIFHHGKTLEFVR